MAFIGLAQIGNETVVQIGSTVIGGILTFIQSGKTNRIKPTSNLASTSTEFIATGLLSPGKFELVYNRSTSDTGQQAILTAFDDKTKPTFTLTMPLADGQTTPDDYTFAALVEELDDCSMISPMRPITTKAILKVSGSIMFSAGH